MNIMYMMQHARSVLYPDYVYRFLSIISSRPNDIKLLQITDTCYNFWSLTIAVRKVSTNKLLNTLFPFPKDHVACFSKTSQKPYEHTYFDLNTFSISHLTSGTSR